MKKRIYMDNAATRPVSHAVSEAMTPYFGEQAGNPSALYAEGREAACAVAAARAACAHAIGAGKNEFFFTSGGTESDNLALKGAAFSYLQKHGHMGRLIVSAFEHHAVLRAASFLASLGADVQYVFPDADGIVHPDAVGERITEDTFLVAVMYANNEIGTIQPAAEIAALAHAHGIPVFSDAVQAVGQIPLDVSVCGVDMLSLSGHKLGAPKGIGGLYIKEEIREKLCPLLDGGGQENGMRSGTENVPSIVGLAKALTDAVSCEKNAYVAELRDLLFAKLTALDGCIVNGSRQPGKRLPGNVNVSFPGLDAESMVLLLDAAGISASAGSACNAKDTEPSHVLLSVGADRARALSSLRFTLSHENTAEEVLYTAGTVRDIVSRLRQFADV